MLSINSQHSAWFRQRSHLQHDYKRKITELMSKYGVTDERDQVNGPDAYYDEKDALDKEYRPLLNRPEFVSVDVQELITRCWFRAQSPITSATPADKLKLHQDDCRQVAREILAVLERVRGFYFDVPIPPSIDEMTSPDVAYAYLLGLGQFVLSRLAVGGGQPKKHSASDAAAVGEKSTDDGWIRGDWYRIRPPGEIQVGSDPPRQITATEFKICRAFLTTNRRPTEELMNRTGGLVWKEKYTPRKRGAIYAATSRLNKKLLQTGLEFTLNGDFVLRTNRLQTSHKELSAL